MKRSKTVNKAINKGMVVVWAKLIISGDATTNPKKESETVSLVPKKYREAVDAWVKEYYENQ